MAEEYFDWVEGLHNCDIRAQFANLTNDACANVKKYNRLLGTTSIKVFWDREQSPNVCTVARLSGGGSVEFNLNDDSITVRRLTRDAVVETMKIQATLDEQGQCVLVRDGGRPILRWHLLRKFLGPLFGLEP